jgi:hypothetical protein
MEDTRIFIRDEPFVEIEESEALPTPIFHPPTISAVQYSFSHTPPPTPVRVRISTFRWPGTLQHQGPPSHATLHDIAAWLLPFMDLVSTAKL